MGLKNINEQETLAKEVFERAHILIEKLYLQYPERLPAYCHDAAFDLLSALDMYQEFTGLKEPNYNN